VDRRIVTDGLSTTPPTPAGGLCTVGESVACHRTCRVRLEQADGGSWWLRAALGAPRALRGLRSPAVAAPRRAAVECECGKKYHAFSGQPVDEPICGLPPAAELPSPP
jgi:hypothetical protein